MVDAAAYDWDQLVDDAAGLRTALAKCQSVNVNRDDLRASAKGLVQRYFKYVRPELRSLECEVEDMEALDGDLQSLLKLAQGRNRKRSYLATLRNIQRTQTKLSNQRLVAIGEKGEAKAESSVIVFTETEKALLTTLLKLIPSAALSYEQAIRDLHDATRVSFRGTANELREALREILSHLAPDDVIMAAPGFKLESGQSRPTRKQRVRHILRARHGSATARKPPEDAVALVEELTASLTRSTYDRSNLSAHAATARREVKQIKMYIDSVLSDLLEIHD